MNKILTPNRVELMAWLALCGGLVTGVGIETQWGRQLVWPLMEENAAFPPFQKAALTELFHIPPPEKFIEIALRPVFVVTRSPAPIPPPPEAPKPKMRKEQFVLSGTTIVADGKFAHLVEKAGKKSHVVAEGKEINGILVKEIMPDQVILIQFDDTERLMLNTAKAPLLPSTDPLAAIPAADGASAKAVRRPNVFGPAPDVVTQ